MDSVSTYLGAYKFLGHVALRHFYLHKFIVIHLKDPINLFGARDPRAWRYF